MQFSGATPGIARIELHDPWGEVELVSLSDLNQWSLDLRPDRPQVSRIRLQLEGSGDDVVDMKLSLNACAQGRSTW